MKKNGLYKRMLRNSIVPVLVLGLVIMFFCYYRFTNTLYDEAAANMRTTATSVMEAYNLSYEGDYVIVKGADERYYLYKGELDITADNSIVDKFSRLTDTEISLLYKDIRIHTTFRAEFNARLVGISTNAETSTRVLDKGEDVLYKNIEILKEKYLVLYVPMYNSDNTIIGMVEIARNVRSMKADVWKAVWPILVLIALGMGLAMFYSYRSTKDLTSVIKKLQSFMNRVASGNLIVELDSGLTKRTDELGDMAKSSVSMQRSIRNFVGTDALTGLHNRRYLADAIQRIKDRSSETGTPFSVAITDIDFFKKVNDTYGHNAGDEVLKNVANILKQNMAGNGFASRWGGEEFVLIFDKTNMKDSLPILEKMLDTIRESVVETEGYEIKVTMTMGIVDGSLSEIEEMVEAADAKLYYGKTHGRNQIVSEIPEE